MSRKCLKQLGLGCVLRDMYWEIEPKNTKHFTFFMRKFTLADMGSANFQGGALSVRTNGAMLKALRKSHKFTQEHVQTACAIKSHRLTQYESGHPCNIYDLRSLATFYSIDAEEITNLDDLTRLAKVFNDLAKLYPRHIGSNGSL